MLYAGAVRKIINTGSMAMEQGDMPLSSSENMKASFITAAGVQEEHEMRWPPQCLASTPRQPTAPDEDDGNLFRSAQWTPDGTCVVAQRNNHTIETYMLYVCDYAQSHTQEYSG